MAADHDVQMRPPARGGEASVRAAEAGDIHNAERQAQHGSKPDGGSDAHSASVWSLPAR
jgi:hypothetical protein